MPEAALIPKHDWKLAKALYMRGLGPKQIELETGIKARTISHRVAIDGWLADKQHIDNQLAVIPLEIRGKQLRSDLLEVVENNVDKMLEAPANTPDGITDQLLQAKNATETVSKLLNWDKETKAPLISLTLLSTPPEKLFSDMQVVDVESVSVDKK